LDSFSIYAKNFSSQMRKLLDPSSISMVLEHGTADPRAHPGGLLDCNTPNPPKPRFKRTDFVNIMISKVLRDLPFS
jgi:hypothetical protein